MNYEEMMEDFHATAANYADPDEYEHLTTVAGMHQLLSTKFFALKKYVDVKVNKSCKKCFGRGYTVPIGGGRLRGCKCLRKKK